MPKSKHGQLSESVAPSISMSPTIGQCIQLIQPIQPLDVQWLPSRDLASGLEVTLICCRFVAFCVDQILHPPFCTRFELFSTLDFKHGTKFFIFYPGFLQTQRKLEKNNSQKLKVWIFEIFRKCPEAFDALQCLEHPSTASVPHRWVLELHSWTSHRLAS